MANAFTYLMTKILAGALDVLTEELTMCNLITKDFAGSAAKKGEQVSVSVPVAQAAAAISPNPNMPSVTDNAPTEKLITIDQWYGSRFHVTEKEAAQINAASFIPGQIGEAARAIARTVNANILAKYTGIYGYAGTAGTVPFATTLAGAVAARRVLNRQFCPDGNRHLVLGYDAEDNALNLPAVQEALKRGSDMTLNKGVLGELIGLMFHRDGQIPTHTSTVFTAGAVTINGAHAAGVKTVSIAKATNTSPLVAGDIISFAGIAGTYTVVTGVTLAVGNTDVTIEPGLEAAASGSEVVTLRATHVVNLAFDPGAFGLVMRTLSAEIEGAPTAGQHLDMVHQQSGIPLRLSYYPGYHLNQWELSTLWGASVLDARRAARLAG